MRFPLLVAVFVASVQSWLLQVNEQERLCDEVYTIQRPLKRNHDGYEVYSATQMSTGHKVQVSYGLPMEEVKNNEYVWNIMDTTANVDSSHFLRVHCVTEKTTTVNDDETRTISVMVQDDCKTLDEHINQAHFSFDSTTVEALLLPQLKTAIQEMRKVNLVHGSLNLKSLHWCQVQVTGERYAYAGALRLSSFFHAHMVIDGLVVHDPRHARGQRMEDTIAPEVRHHGELSWVSDLYSVGILILEMLQLNEYYDPTEWKYRMHPAV